MNPNVIFSIKGNDDLKNIIIGSIKTKMIKELKIYLKAIHQTIDKNEKILTYVSIVINNQCIIINQKLFSKLIIFIPNSLTGLKNLKRPENNMLAFVDFAIIAGYDILKKILEVFYKPKVGVKVIDYNIMYYLDFAIQSGDLKIVHTIFITCDFTMEIDIILIVTEFIDKNFYIGDKLEKIIYINEIFDKIKKETCLIYSNFNFHKKFIHYLKQIQYSNLSEFNKNIYDTINENYTDQLNLNYQYSIKYITDILYRNNINYFLQKENFKLILDLSNYSGLINISLIKNAYELHLNECLSISNVDELANVTTLALNNCQNVKDISKLKNVKNLDLSQCNRIVDVSELCNVHNLSLYKCTNVNDFSMLGNINKLVLSKEQLTPDIIGFKNLLVI